MMIEIELPTHHERFEVAAHPGLRGITQLSGGTVLHDANEAEKTWQNAEYSDPQDRGVPGSGCGRLESSHG
jgi:hypothetical protein